MTPRRMFVRKTRPALAAEIALKLSLKPHETKALGWQFSHASLARLHRALHDDGTGAYARIEPDDASPS